MPEMDGYEVLDRIKKNELFCHIPVIMISAVDEIDSVLRCIENGADDYLVKPFNPTLLKARIGACLEKKQHHDLEQQLFAELKEKHEALQKAEQSRDALVHMIVHDLRSPLMAVLLATELLQMEVSENKFDEADFTKRLQQIHISTEEMTTLIKSILDASKLEAGDMQVSLIQINALQLMKDLCSQFEFRAQRKGIHLSYETESDDLIVRADRELLTRILQNLLVNALKYTAAAKNITLSVKRGDGRVVFCVANDGPGIPEEYKEKIFEKFFQLEIGDERKKYGVGLGLAFCKMAVETQGGKIWVESEEGKGASFKVALEAWDK